MHIGSWSGSNSDLQPLDCVLSTLLVLFVEKERFYAIVGGSRHFPSRSRRPWAPRACRWPPSCNSFDGASARYRLIIVPRGVLDLGCPGHGQPTVSLSAVGYPNCRSREAVSGRRCVNAIAIGASPSSGICWPDRHVGSFTRLRRSSTS